MWGSGGVEGDWGMRSESAGCDLVWVDDKGDV